MPKKEVPLGQLQDYLPDGTYNLVITYLTQYKIHLTITRDRKTILGDYRHKTLQDNHRISITGSLNKYAFLITLLHEIAHLLTYEEYGNRIAAHGKEWKHKYTRLLADFVERKVFPEAIEHELRQSLKNPAASTCAEEGLLRVLRTYDEKKQHVVFVEDIPQGAHFRTVDGRVFQKKEKLRKRYKAVEVKTGKDYLFSPVYEVEKIAE